MSVTSLLKLIRGPSCFSRASAIAVFITITVAGYLPAAEQVKTAPQTTFQRIKQLTAGLKYSNDVAEDFVAIVYQWQTNHKIPIIVTLEENLSRAKDDYRQGKVSKEQLAETEKKAAASLIDRIRKEIAVNENYFDLADIIKYKQAQCLGYSQLFYILGSSIGLSVRPINVLELQTSDALPARFSHLTCMVDLSDGRTIILNLAPNGFLSRPFKFEEQFARAGNYWQLKGKVNSLNIYRKIQLLDRKGLIAHIYNSRGVNCISSGQLSEAISDFDHAISLDPNCAQAWNNRANAYAKSGRLEKALSDYEMAVKLNPNFGQFRSNRASVYIKLSRFEQAISDCNHAIELNPHLAIAWNNRANAYANKGQFDKAIGDYNRALSIDSTFCESYFNRAAIYCVLGQYKKAISDFNRAEKLNPLLPQVYYNRGNTYAKLKQYDKAIADYNRAIELNPNYEKAMSSRAIASDLSEKSQAPK